MAAAPATEWLQIVKLSSRNRGASELELQELIQALLGSQQDKHAPEGGTRAFPKGSQILPVCIQQSRAEPSQVRAGKFVCQIDALPLPLPVRLPPSRRPQHVP